MLFPVQNVHYTLIFGEDVGIEELIKFAVLFFGAFNSSK